MTEPQAETREPMYYDDDGNPVYPRNVVCMSRECWNYYIVIPVPDDGSPVFCGGGGPHPTTLPDGTVVDDPNITPDPENPVPDVLPPDPNPVPPNPWDRVATPDAEPAESEES